MTAKFTLPLILILALMAAVAERVWDEVSYRLTYPEFHPVLGLDFESFSCDVDNVTKAPDLIARGWLVKNYAIVNETLTWGELKSFAIYSADGTKRLISWKRAASLHEGDGDGGSSLVDRTPGYQEINLRLVGMCGKAFEIHVTHLNPHNRDEIIRTGWGPYNTKQLVPDPKRLY